jgi:hypothetical protein
MFVLILWSNSPDRVKAASSLRFLDYTQARAPCRTDQLVAVVATFTADNRQTYLNTAGFEPAIPAIMQVQIHILDRTDTSWN